MLKVQLLNYITVKNKSSYITRLLAILVLTVLIGGGMRAQDVDHVWATKLTGEVEWRFKALKHTEQDKI